MELRFEPLFVVGAILVAAMFDLLVRWLTGKTAKARPPEVDTALMFVQEDDTDMLEDGLGEPHEAPVSPPPASLSPASSSPHVPLSRSLPPAPGLRRRRQRGRRWLEHPTDARRGIVLMAVLGPCPGLETPRRDA